MSNFVHPAQLDSSEGTQLQKKTGFVKDCATEQLSVLDNHACAPQ
jgi:hypothetical protein